jgi:hypothetical protein
MRRALLRLGVAPGGGTRGTSFRASGCGRSFGPAIRELSSATAATCGSARARRGALLLITQRGERVGRVPPRSPSRIRDRRLCSFLRSGSAPRGPSGHARALSSSSGAITARPTRRSFHLGLSSEMFDRAASCLRSSIQHSAPHLLRLKIRPFPPNLAQHGARQMTDNIARECSKPSTRSFVQVRRVASENFARVIALAPAAAASAARGRGRPSRRALGRLCKGRQTPARTRRARLRHSARPAAGEGRGRMGLVVERGGGRVR